MPMRCTSSTRKPNSASRGEPGAHAMEQRVMMATRRTVLRHGLGALVAGCGLALGLSVCAATDLTVWHAYRGDEKAAFEKVVGQFNAKQKDVAVKTLAVPYDAYADKIT